MNTFSDQIIAARIDMSKNDLKKLKFKEYPVIYYFPRNKKNNPIRFDDDNDKTED